MTRGDMDVFEAIEQRRSAKRFTDRPVPREQIERLLGTAVWAPNHKMTEPWGFVVLGPEAKRRYGEIRGSLKAHKAKDPEAAAAVREKVVREVVETPVLLAVTCAVDEDPITREEDYAATWMGVENLLLAATGAGLAGYIRTGRIMDRDELREALGVPPGRRIIALIDLGEPAELPAPKRRTPAAEKTRWLP